MRVSFQTQSNAICAQVCVVVCVQVRSNKSISSESFAKGLTNLMEIIPSPGKKKKASSERNVCTENESDENLEQTLGEEEGEKEEQTGAGDGDTHDEEREEHCADAADKHQNEVDAEWDKMAPSKPKPKTTKPEKKQGENKGQSKSNGKGKSKGRCITRS